MITWRGQTLRASGDIGLRGRAPAIKLEAATQNFTIESILAGMNKADVPASGNIELKARIAGTTKAPAVDVDIAGSNLMAYREPLGTLAASGVLRGDLFTLNQLRLEKPQPDGPGVLEASGTFDLETKAVALNAKSNDLQLTALTLPDGRPVRGQVRLNATATGTSTQPEGTAEIAAADLKVGDLEIGAITADARAANGAATINAKLPAFNLAANGQLATEAPYPARIEVRADNTDLASLPVQMKQPVQGNVTAVVRFTGELSNPQQGEASAEIAALDLTYNEQPLRSEGPLVARYANQRLTIDRATLVARDSRISLTGTLPLEATAGEGEINLNAALDLPSLVQYVPNNEGIQAQGTATIAGTIRGTMKRVDPNITIAVNNGYVLAPSVNPPVSGVNVQGQIRNGALELASATASIGPATLTASGTVPFGLLPADLPVELPRRQGPASFTAELQDLDLATIQALPDQLSGTVSARFEATAARPELAAVTGRLTLPTFKLRYGTIGLEQQGTSSVTLAGGTAFVENFHLVGPETNISVAGSAELAGNRALDLSVSGTSDAALLSAFAEDVRAEGKTEFRVALAGTAAAPAARGYLQIADGTFSLREPRVGIEGLDLRVDLDGTRATISRLGGSLNGGELTGGGTVDFTGGTLRAADLGVKATGVYLDIPEGLKTLSDVELKIAPGANDTIVLGGQVTVADGGFTDDLYFDRGVLASLGQERGIEVTDTRNPMMERIRFNIGVRTDNPIVVDNNLAEAEITADLRLLGNPYEFGLSGRLEILEGGELRLQEREYLVERGTILFTSDRKIEPMLDVLATTTAGGYDIRLQVSGRPGDTETTLTSDPPLPEPDILALLLTGRTMEELRGNEFEVARNQVLSYLTGRVGSQLGRGIAGATGLSTVRIEPNLIAAEADPSARLTVGQNISRNLEVIYSMDLINSSDQIWVAEYDLTRRFTTRGVRQADGSFRMDFRHDLRFGGIIEPRRGDKRVQRRVGNVNIVGARYFSDMKIADKFDIEAGDKYDFFKTRKGLDRVNKMYKEAGLLESKVRLRRQQQEGSDTVDLNLTVAPGPEVQFVFEGASVPDKIQNRVRDIWRDGVFDTQRAEEAVEALRGWLVDNNRLQAQIEYRISRPAEGRKRVVFDINPGPVFRNVQVAFEGATAFKDKDLREVIEDQKLETEIYIAPGRVTELLGAFYREQGYLDVRIDNPRYELDEKTATGRVVFPVAEGPLFRVGTVSFEGNSVYTEAQLNEMVPVPVGEEYRPVLRQNALDRLRQAYWDIGFNDVETTYVMSRSPIAGTVGITFRIVENQQAVLREITVAGRHNTSEALVRSQIGLKPGDIVDLNRVAEARRNLYETGAYSLVEIEREEITADAGTGEGTRTRTPDAPAEKQMRLAVRVREIQPWEFRYGGFFDTERGPGGILDVSNRNMLGSARVLGLRTRYDTQLREARLYFSQPNLLRFPLRTIASPYIRQERNPAGGDTDPFNVDRIGFSLQQEATWRENWLLNYGYRIERTRTYDPSADALFDVPLRIGSLTSTLTHETRDDILDATRGGFMSHALQWSPSVLGSELRFVKYFGQYFRYIPLQKPRVELFTNQVLRPRLVYAAGARVGLAQGFGGQEVPLSERFFAGGGTSIRGFEQNAIGPKLVGQEPAGGQALLIVNNEIRFPVVSIFDGVGFVDVGNVYRRVSDFSFADIRKTAGVGVRVRTPWFLLRLDYGVKLDRQPGEGRGRLFFSIGQAF
ncbi:MAG TPA: translocation/assembly module TamB domain-containing protein [Bryobacteraceae bacterium]|nr:translocation/assembly module TamB domain-containing protein [Bryobacteraceae bacterium]